MATVGNGICAVTTFGTLSFKVIATCADGIAPTILPSPWNATCGDGIDPEIDIVSTGSEEYESEIVMPPSLESFPVPTAISVRPPLAVLVML